MDNRGYTLIDLIVVAAIAGIITMIGLSKASYAFSDLNEIRKETNETIITNCAIKYGESIIETLKKENIIYLTGSDLKAAGYLVDDENKMHNIKLKLIYNEENNHISAQIINN